MLILFPRTAVEIYANILGDEACLVKRDRISPVPYYDIIWNPEPGGNVEHIAENDLTPDDVEAVLLYPVAEDISRSSGRPMVYGFTPDGRYIVVVYEGIDDHTLYPVTAYVVGI